MVTTTTKIDQIKIVGKLNESYGYIKVPKSMIGKMIRIKVEEL
jgi:hypothetical protein